MKKVPKNIINIYNGPSFNKNKMIKGYEYFKQIEEDRTGIDKEMISLCDLINYNNDDCNSSFCCCGHDGRPNSNGYPTTAGYLVIKCKNMDVVLEKIKLLNPNSKMFKTIFEWLVIMPERNSLHLTWNHYNFQKANSYLYKIFETKSKTSKK